MRQGMILKTRPRIVVTKALEQHGSVSDKDGRATAKLAALVNNKNSNFTNLLVAMEQDGLIIRHVNGKRTYEIILGELPDYWPRYEGNKEVEEPQVEVVQIPETFVEEQTETEDVELLADALIKRVVAILNTPVKYQADQERLSSILAENDKLRQHVKMVQLQLSEAVDTVSAKVVEINRLRRQVRELEENLRAATKNTNRIVDSEVRKQLSKLMREIPREAAN